MLRRGGGYVEKGGGYVEKGREGMLRRGGGVC